MKIPAPGDVLTKVETLVTLTRAGIVHPERPDHLFHTVRALMRFGTTPAAGFSAAARNHADEPALIDELGTLSFKDVHERSNALARALAADGIASGDNVAVMCRNHRGWVDATVACSKLGANALFLNTAFSGPQLADVAKREKPKAVIFDHEFDAVLHDASRRRKRYVAWHEPDDGPAKDPRLEDVIARHDGADLAPPAQQGRAIILTSGTTGQPKGANRSMPKTLDPIAALLSVIPLRAGERTMIAAPLFHSWGFANWALGISLGSTVVLERRFDDGGDAVADRAARVHGARRGAGDDPADPRARRRGARPLRPTSACAPFPSAAARFPARSRDRLMDHFGEILYNLYGSTEVAWATIATPRDLRAAPVPPAGRRAAAS